MEKKLTSTDKGKQVVSCHWNSNSMDYQNQVSFFWRQNSIRIDIRSYCDPPGKDKSVHYHFIVNEKYFHQKILYNYMGIGRVGNLPEVQSDGYKLEIKAYTGFFEICEVQSEIDATKNTPTVQLQEKEKVKWFSIYKNYEPGFWYDTPFKDDQVILWIKKVYSYQSQAGLLMFKYEFYSSNLIFITPRQGNFSFYKLFDFYKSIKNDNCPYIACEISDENGIFQTFCWKRSGTDALPVQEIITFLDSLKCYNNWEDYEQHQTLFRTQGMDVLNIHTRLMSELSYLGIYRIYYK